MEILANPWKSMEKYKIDTTEFNLLPNERLESFWDALWLGIRTFCVARFVRLEQLCGKISRNPYESMQVGVGMGVCLSARSFM